MSKSKGNVVNQDDIVHDFGADTLRLYEMFMGPLDASIAWSEKGLEGSRRFLDRVYRLFIDEETGQLNPNIVDLDDKSLEKIYHQTVKKVSEDYEQLHFNTAISQLMIYLNAAREQSVLPKTYMEGFLTLIAPITPHLAEELWQAMGHTQSISLETWPTYEEALTKDETVEVVIQVNGKLIKKMDIEIDLSNAEVETMARKMIEQKTDYDHEKIRKVIVVPNRLVNIVIK